MVTVETYITNTINLVRSLTIKSNDIAVHMNNELIKIYGTSILGTNAEDKTQWKYYMNLCGDYHAIDNPIKLTIIETGTVKELSKEVLAQYPTTLSELLKHDDYYTDLIDSYPDDELLIKGMMYGLDMDYVLDADEGEILSYSTYYVETQESNLIREVATYSINFFKRWHVREYGLIDDLYLPSLLSTLYSKLVLKVLNVRYGNIYTSNIHTFHIFEFFRSHFDIDISILNESTRFWLYKNMRYIRKHIGSNETINIIIEKILTNNGIGIAEIELINSLPDIELLDNSDVSQALYDEKTNSFVSKPRNDYYLNSDSDSITPYQMLITQFDSNLVDNDLVIKDTTEIDSKYVPRLDPNILHRQKTKTFKLKINKSHVVTQSVSMKLLLDNWTYLVYDDKFRTIKKFIDPNTGITYNISAKQGLLMVFKLMSKMLGIDNPIIKGYTATNLIREDVDYETLTKNIIRDDVLETIIRKLMERVPHDSTYIGDDKFNDYISDVTTFNSLIWNITSNTNDMLLNSDLQVIYNRLHKKEYISFGDDKTIDEHISDEGLYYELNLDYDYEGVLKELFELFTGYKIGDEDVEAELNKYINITKKLSSYTVQFISDKNDLDTIPLRYHGLETINKGLVDLKESTFRALEDFYGYVTGTAIPYADFLEPENEVIGINNNRMISPPTLIMYDLGSSILSNLVSDVAPRAIGHVESFVDMYEPDIQSTALNDAKVLEMDAMNGLSLDGEAESRKVEVIMTDGSVNSTDNVTMVGHAEKLGIDLFSPGVDGQGFNADVGEGGFNMNLFIREYSTTETNLELEATGYSPDSNPILIANGSISLYTPFFIRD